MLRQPPPNRSRLLRAQVQWEILFVFVKETELGALDEVDGGEDARDAFSHVMPLRNRVVSHGAVVIAGMRGEWLTA